MPSNSYQKSDPNRIAVICACGMYLKASPKLAGKHLKCPACGGPVVIPSVTPRRPADTAPADDEAGGMSSRTLIAMWSLPGVFTLGGILFLVWHSRIERAPQGPRILPQQQERSTSTLQTDGQLSARQQKDLDDAQALRNQLAKLDALWERHVNELKNTDFHNLSEAEQRQFFDRHDNRSDELSMRTDRILARLRVVENRIKHWNPEYITWDEEFRRKFGLPPE